MPGEHNVIKWKTDQNLSALMKREEGSKTPLFVLIYDVTLAKDCCASNFERAVLRYKPVVDKVVANFKTFKMEREAGLSEELSKRLGLDPKKPAMVMLDGEGYVLHVQQKCIDPKAYNKAIDLALSVNGKRIAFRNRDAKEQRRVRKLIAKGEFRKALTKVEKFLERKDEVAGSVIERVQKDFQDIESKGQELLKEAEALRDQMERVKALKLFKEIEEEFAKLQEIGKVAERCASDLERELRKAGLTGF